MCRGTSCRIRIENALDILEQPAITAERGGQKQRREVGPAATKKCGASFRVNAVKTRQYQNRIVLPQPLDCDHVNGDWRTLENGPFRDEPDLAGTHEARRESVLTQRSQQESTRLLFAGRHISCGCL